MQPEVASRISVCADALGITEAELARRLGVSQTQVWRWKTQGGISSKWLVPLAQTLGTSVDYLLTGKEVTGPTLDTELLEYIVERVRELEDLTEAQIAPARFAKLIALLYDEALRDGKPADAEVSKLLRLVT